MSDDLDSLWPSDMIKDEMSRLGFDDEKDPYAQASELIKNEITGGMGLPGWVFDDEGETSEASFSSSDDDGGHIYVKISETDASGYCPCVECQNGGWAVSLIEKEGYLTHHSICPKCGFYMLNLRLNASTLTPWSVHRTMPVISDNAWDCSGFIANLAWDGSVWIWEGRQQLDNFVLADNYAKVAPRTMAQASNGLEPGQVRGEKRQVICVKNKTKRKDIPLTTEMDMVVLRHQRNEAPTTKDSHDQPPPKPADRQDPH